MGPRPRDPRSIQKVDRQRDAGSDLNDIEPRKSRDFEKMIGANKSTEFKVEEGKPLDWAVLMGTNERKALVKSGALRKDDPTYDEVKGIVSHCRKADKPGPEVAAYMGAMQYDELPPPKEPEDKELSFKKKISKLMQGLKQILENNAERQVKYVSFQQRCNMHIKDIEGILARRALATMAYAHGAENSPRLMPSPFSDFLRAFWAENPHRFPVNEADIVYLWQICDAGDTSLLSEMVFVQPYIERSSFGFEFTQKCWGRPREGFMRLRR